jgi:tRNA threonylcarbamoyladenosine biosynthesis protein TsaB
MINSAENTAPGQSPRILAIETSGRQGSVAIALGEKLLAQLDLSPHLRHAVELMPAIEALCREQGWIPDYASTPADPPPICDEVYLSLGPGSFTGLRIAVAIGRAMAQGMGCRLIGVPSLDVIAENAPAQFGVVVPILDAKRGQVFAARYERNPAHGLLERAAEPALVEPGVFLKDAAEHARRLRTKVAILGEGIDYHRAAIPTAREMTELDRALWFGQAAVVHRLGRRMARRGEFTNMRALLPIYIRLPEAEEVWRKKHGAG